MIKPHQPLTAPVQKVGHWPARYPPFPPSAPAACQVERYGDRTAKGMAGGRPGVNVEACDCAAMTDIKLFRHRSERSILTPGVERKWLEGGEWTALPSYPNSTLVMGCPNEEGPYAAARTLQSKYSWHGIFGVSSWPDRHHGHGQKHPVSYCLLPQSTTRKAGRVSWLHIIVNDLQLCCIPYDRSAYSRAHMIPWPTTCNSRVCWRSA